jgi:hypothetical protein
MAVTEKPTMSRYNYNFSIMKKDELMKGLSIEELQERKEFTAIADDGCWCDPTPPCCFGE